jgi:excisionase family DNA binding protein
LSTEWLSIRQAAEILGVHPSTVRLWADKGILPVHRTEGGHRRFRQSDLQIWLKSRTSGTEDIPNALSGRILEAIRQKIMAGDLQNEGWYQRLSDEARGQYRASGKHLLRGLQHFLSRTDKTTAIGEAHALGYEYASRARRYDLDLTEAVQAFLFFRKAMFAGIYEMLEQLHTPLSPSHRHLLDDIVQFTDLILLSLIQTYTLLQGNGK